MYRVFFLLLISTSLYSQSKKEIELELKNTKAKLDSIQTLYFQQQLLSQQKILQLESTIEKIKLILINNSSSTLNIVTQDLNNNVDNQKSPKPEIIKSNSGAGQDGLTPKTGATIYVGPRGGRYYINKNGNKTYIKKK
jgi:hypothetical protein